MENKRRETILKIAVGVVVGLFVLDWLVLTPAATAWKAQGERLATLRRDVTRGRQLLEREKSLRGRWAEMHRTDLDDDLSVAEDDVYKAIFRWTRESKVSFTSLTPDPRQHEGYDTLEFRASANGDQGSFARLLYEIETDPLAARVLDFDISARDAKGQQLALTMKFSFVRITENGRSGR